MNIVSISGRTYLYTGHRSVAQIMLEKVIPVRWRNESTYLAVSAIEKITP